MRLIAIALALGLTGCAGADAVRMSQNELVIKAGAAPICGSSGAVRVATKTAAIETLKAGYDSFIVLDEAGRSSFAAMPTGGSYSTVGTARRYGNTTNVTATTTYTPNAPIIVGRHSQDLYIHMFRAGERGSENAISARQVLGPDWQDIAKSSVMTCF